MVQWEKSIILFLLKNLLNAEMHDWPSDDIHSKKIIAHSFITTMNWYNRFMHKIEVNPDPQIYYTKAKPKNAPFVAPKENYTGWKNLGKHVRVTKDGYLPYKQIAYWCEEIKETKD